MVQVVVDDNAMTMDARVRERRLALGRDADRLAVEAALPIVGPAPRHSGRRWRSRLDVS
jgi:hypothetical protein